MRILTLLLTCLVLVYSVDAFAARSESIAVVVNEDAITMSDVQDRMGLIIASAGLRNTKDIRGKLMPQVIGSLVDEVVRMQEARRLDLSVSQAEIDQGFATIAQQNNMEANQFRSMIERGGVDVGTMESQIRAQVAWSKVVQAKLRPQVIVTDSDIDNHLERLVSNTGKPEYLLSEIYLPIENPKEAAQTQQLAQKLVQEIRSGEAPFFKVAQQFSKSAGAPQGGDLGWVGQGQLQQEVDAMLPRIAVGQVSDPIRTSTGFHIVNVREQRSVTPENLPTREQVMTQLGLQRLERLQHRYLLDLKSAAFIENRVEF